MHIVILILSLLLVSTGAAAQTTTVQAQNPWARATQPGRPGVVYLDLSGGPDKLLGAQADIAGRAELHETVVQDGVARMRPVAGLLISPGARTRLMPGGPHLMLLDIKKPLKAGESFQLTLTFDRAGPLVISVPVVSVRAGAPPGAGHDAGHGSGHSASHDMPARR